MNNIIIIFFGSTYAYNYYLLPCWGHPINDIFNNNEKIKNN